MAPPRVGERLRDAYLTHSDARRNFTAPPPPPPRQLLYYANALARGRHPHRRRRRRTAVRRRPRSTAATRSACAVHDLAHAVDTQGIDTPPVHAALLHLQGCLGPIAVPCTRHPPRAARPAATGNPANLPGSRTSRGRTHAMTDTSTNASAAAATSHAHLVPALRQRRARTPSATCVQPSRESGPHPRRALAFGGALVDKLPHIAAAVTASLRDHPRHRRPRGRPRRPRTRGWHDHRGRTPGDVLTAVEADEQPARSPPNSPSSATPPSASTTTSRPPSS
ncbi:hypothetical protein ACU686_26685 [Yinghuangia aomiensis]